MRLLLEVGQKSNWCKLDQARMLILQNFINLASYQRMVAEEKLAQCLGSGPEIFIPKVSWFDSHKCLMEVWNNISELIEMSQKYVFKNILVVFKSTILSLQHQAEVSSNQQHYNWVYFVQLEPFIFRSLWAADKWEAHLMHH